MVFVTRDDVSTNNGQARDELATTLYAEQNFPAAVVGGATAMLLAAGAYGVVVARWAYAYGFAAAGVGIVVGLAVGFLGRGITGHFAVLAVVYTLTGCVLGSVLTVVFRLAAAMGQSPVSVLLDQPLLPLVERAFAGASAIDLVYLFVAVAAAVFFSKRPLSRSQYFAIRSFDQQG